METEKQSFKAVFDLKYHSFTPAQSPWLSLRRSLKGEAALSVLSEVKQMNMDQHSAK